MIPSSLVRAFCVSLLFLIIVVPASAEYTISLNATYANPYHETTTAEYATIITAPGDSTETTNPSAGCYVPRGATGSQTYLDNCRFAMVFPPPNIPEDATITNVSVKFRTMATGASLGEWELGITGLTPTSNTTAWYRDYRNYSTSEISTRKARTALSTSNYNYYYFTEAAIENVSKTESNSYMLRSGADIDGSNSTITWASGGASNYYRPYNGDSTISTNPIMNITYTATNESDTTPPLSITGLTNTSVSCSAHNFNWTNPTAADYGGLMIWRNNTAQTNLTNTTTSVAWTGLPESTAITFSSKTFDLVGNVNATFTNMTATTSACGSPPVANFTANRTEVCTVDYIQFTDTSTNTPTSWNWSFGDGNLSTSQNPTKLFNITGLYTINLTANNTYGADSEVKTNYINVSACAAPTPTPTPAPTTLPGTCIFTNITGAALGENSTEWSVTQGDYTWGTLITNASQGNISYYVCPKAPDPWTPEINPPSPDSLIGTAKLWIKQTLKDVLE